MRLTVAAVAMGVVYVLAGSSVSAQTVEIGTTKGGATARISATIAKIVSDNSKIRINVRPMGGVQDYVASVNSGELEFGLSNMPQYWMAKLGMGLSKRGHGDLRLVANLMVFQVGVLVPVKSGIKAVKDLKGKRVPSGFKTAPLFDFIVRGILANGGAADSTTKVPTATLRRHWEMMAEGKIDMSIAAVGSGRVRVLNAKVDGGVRFVSLDNSESALRALRRIYPKSYLKQVNPGKRFIGVREPVYTLNYDYLIWTHKGMPDDVVYRVTKALYENEKALKAAGPLWRSFAAQTMAKDHGTPYHIGALKLYREAGLLN